MTAPRPGSPAIRFDEISRMAKLIADPNRTRILTILANDNRTVRSIAEDVGLSIQATNLHIIRLRTSGMVDAVGYARGTTYQLNHLGQQLVESIRILSDISALPHELALAEEDAPAIPSVEYRPVVGFPGYEIGDDGTIRSQRALRVYSKIKNCGWYMMRTYKDKLGYRNIILVRDGKKYARKIHRLVLEAFVGPRPDGMEACHFPDPNPSNNRLENLRWDTRSENCRDKYRPETIQHRGCKPNNNGGFNRILDENSVRQIRELRRQGVKIKEIAGQFNVSLSLISHIITGRAWAHVQ